MFGSDHSRGPILILSSPTKKNLRCNSSTDGPTGCSRCASDKDCNCANRASPSRSSDFGNHGFRPHKGASLPLDEALARLDSLVHWEDLGLGTCNTKGFLQRSRMWIALSQRCDGSQQTIDLCTCFGGHGFWGATARSLRKNVVSLHPRQLRRSPGNG